jgi:delta14-sterol reductase/lamin-B receptor
MGTILNPRLGRHDLKFFFESRVGMGGWAAFAILLPAAQIETQGELSTAMLVVTLCQAIYIVDFFVLEANLLSMIDIIEENLGFMLWIAFLVWMPFNFTMQQQYILAAEPQLPLWAAVGLVLLNAGGYYIFRSANLQKQQFRRDPRRPIWGRTPQSMQTKRGTKLLLSGWWGIARHANYFGDMLMAAAWCMACGFGSVVPFFYVIYFVPLLIDRERRDNAICQRKYGDDWDRYCEKVPYRIVPFVY